MDIECTTNVHSSDNEPRLASFSAAASDLEAKKPVSSRSRRKRDVQACEVFASKTKSVPPALLHSRGALLRTAAAAGRPRPAGPGRPAGAAGRLSRPHEDGIAPRL